MSTVRRRFLESPKYQGVNERVAYTCTTTPWGGTPTGVAVKLFDSANTDVSATKLSGSAGVTGDVITTPLVVGLASAAKYRLVVQFVSAGNTVEVWGEIIGED